MRHLKDEATAGRQTTRKARFSAIVAAVGKPEVYLPLSDPENDQDFMKAVKQNRVLSIRQDPVSNHTDYGVVGFNTQKHTTYLVFPKPLTAYVDARIIGIKYDVVSGAPAVASRGSRPSSVPRPHRVKRHMPRQKLHPTKTLSRARREIEPTAPRSRQFRIRIRVTTVTEKDVIVSATTKTEARKHLAAKNTRVLSVNEV